MRGRQFFLGGNNFLGRGKKNWGESFFGEGQKKILRGESFLGRGKQNFF